MGPVFCQPLSQDDRVVFDFLLQSGVSSTDLRRLRVSPVTVKLHEVSLRQLEEVPCTNESEDGLPLCT